MVMWLSFIVYLHNIKTNDKITLAFSNNGVDNVSEEN